MIFQCRDALGSGAISAGGRDSASVVTGFDILAPKVSAPDEWDDPGAASLAGKANICIPRRLNM